MRLDQVVLRGTRGAQPAAGTVPAGTTYFVTDEGVTERNSGAAWESFSDSPTDPVPYVDLTEGVPANPAVNVARLYALDVNGYTQVEMRDGSAKVVRLASDNVVVAKVSAAGGVARGQCLYLAGATGANPLVQLAKADDLATLPTIGLALDAGALNAFIRVLTSGTLALLNTSAFTEGDALFVSPTTAGAFVTTLPTTPNYAQRVGFVTRSHATNGEVLVLTTGVVTPPRLHAATHNTGGTDPITALDAAVITTGTIDVARLPAGAGDVVGPAASVASEIALFDGTTGKLLKRATGTGPAKVTAGVLSVAAIDLSGSEVTGTLASARLATPQKTRALTFVFDNGASDLVAATQTLPVSCPYAGTITAARLLSPQTGAIVLDVWKDVFASYPPTVGDTITASAKPTLSAANAVDVTLTSWVTAVAAGDVFVARVDSCTGIHACTLQLTLVVT